MERQRRREEETKQKAKEVRTNCLIASGWVRSGRGEGAASAQEGEGDKAGGQGGEKVRLM